ncbi:uncharacterized protein LOC122265845 [Penaeus japonicus]|uniref:uncharacterized protein LOC122265845 n=1 Tax=Penaeus japonicus TaxID=27405 RepID=UPI001C714407|nr:uncharacterized protein LOC122265845 [Penaeus japonicus]
MVPMEVRRGRDGEPFAVRTKLGWTVNGPLHPQRTSNLSFGNYIDETVDHSYENANWESVKQFWDIESQTDIDEKGWSVEDGHVIDLWKREGSRVGAHHQLPIPFREQDPRLPDNWTMARRRLDSLKSRLERNVDLHQRYVKEVEDLIKKGFAERVHKIVGPLNKTWYLPHHPVFNPNKPDKLTIVFDCAASFKGVNLNKKVMQGPDLMNNLLGILLRFREGRVALAADIEAMFHQVHVTPRDRDVLRFLWWPGGDLSENPTRMKANIQQQLKKKIYVDDLLLSTNSEEEAAEYAINLRDTLQAGGFRLTKWMSNSRKVMRVIPTDERSPRIKDINLTIDNLPMDRALGVLWDLDDDVLKIRVSTPMKPTTRRGILSIMSSIFDPLGLLAPFTIK